jgi:hypothetical protein
MSSTVERELNAVQVNPDRTAGASTGATPGGVVRPCEQPRNRDGRGDIMNRLFVMVSGLSLAVIAIVGCVDTARNDHTGLAVLFGILAVGLATLTLGEARRGSIVLRRDLATWVERTSAVTGETPDELTSRAVSRLRAGFTATSDDPR